MGYVLPTLAGVPGGLVAAYHQHGYDTDHPIFGDYTDETLLVWLAVGLLGPAFFAYAGYVDLHMTCILPSGVLSRVSALHA